MNESQIISKNKKADSTVSPPRVLLVAPAAPLIGGQVVQATILLENLKKEDSIKINLQPTNPQFLVGLQKIKYVRTLIVSVAYIFGLLKNVPRHDIIHVYSAGDSGFLISTTPAILIAKIFGRKTILNYKHGGAEEHIKNWRNALPTIKLFDRIVTPSDFLVDVFAKFGLKADSIFNVVNTDKYRFRMRENLRPIFLANRNFDELYNVSCILRAFRLIQDTYPQAELMVAGDGAERVKLERLTRDLKLENVKFLGRVTQKEMPELYNRADIYLNSPNIDNMPSSVIEAFASGTPVISTNAGGIPYIVEHGKTGLLVEINDHETLAHEALKILGDKKLAKEIIADARRECEKYAWENVREKWLELYFKLSEVPKDDSK